MAFGLPNAQDLNGIVANLGVIAASLGPEATEALKPIVEQIAGHADALEDKAIAAEVAAEDKLLAGIKPLTDMATAVTAALQSFDGTITITLNKKQ